MAELVGGCIGYFIVLGSGALDHDASHGSSGKVPDNLFGALFGIVNGIVVMVCCVEFLPTAAALDSSAGRVVSTVSFLVGMALIAATLVVEGI